MTAYKNRYSCRLCGGFKLEKVLTLEPTPPANSFVNKNDLSKKQNLIPLDLQFCSNCNHVQLLQVVNPDVLFSHYVYVSGTSQVFLDHFSDYVKDVEQLVDKKGLVIDIGSNDGSLLNFFKHNNWEVLGIEPAQNLSKLANHNNINTINSFFSEQLASNIFNKFGKAKIITANNVFAHVDDLKGIISGLKILMDENSIFVFEVSYLLDVISDILFDTIYHEHVSYHSIKPLKEFFLKNEMKLIDVKKISTHGGSIRGIAQKACGKKKINNSVEDLIKDEYKFGLYNIETYHAFESRIKTVQKNLMSLLENYKKNNKVIYGYGAPAKATTLMYYFGLDSKIIDLIIDDSPLKQNMFSPGLHIPVVSSEILNKKMPDIIIILAWNFASSIIHKNENFIDSGGIIVVPLPEIKEIKKV